MYTLTAAQAKAREGFRTRSESQFTLVSKDSKHLSKHIGTVTLYPRYEENDRHVPISGEGKFCLRGRPTFRPPGDRREPQTVREDILKKSTRFGANARLPPHSIRGGVGRFVPAHLAVEANPDQNVDAASLCTPTNR